MSWTVAVTGKVIGVRVESGNSSFVRSLAQPRKDERLLTGLSFYI